MTHDQMIRKIRKLEADNKDLNKLIVEIEARLKADMDFNHSAVIAGTSAVEFSLASRLGITMDVVLEMLPKDVSAAVQDTIDIRVLELKSTTEVAAILLKKLLASKKES